MVKIGRAEIVTGGLLLAAGAGVVWLYQATRPRPAVDTIGAASIAPQDGTFNLADDMGMIPADVINTNMQGQIQFLPNVGPLANDNGEGSGGGSYVPLFGFIPEVVGAF